MQMYGKTEPANVIPAMDPALKYKELEVVYVYVVHVCVCLFACTYWKALCDGELDIE